MDTAILKYAVFREEAGTVEEGVVDLTEKLRTLSADCLSLKVAHP